MNRRRFISLTGAATMGCLAGCTAASPAPAEPQQPPNVPSAGNAGAWHGTYSGPATVYTALIEYDTSGILGYTPTNEYTLSAEVLLNNPVSTDINTEENPVSLLATSNLSTTGMVVGGDFFIASALIFSTPDYPRPSVIQAWNLRFEGNELVGSLDANRTIVSNLFFEETEQPDYIEVDLGPSNYTFPYGTGIRATRTETGISVVISPPAIGTVTEGTDRVAFAAAIQMELAA